MADRVFHLRSLLLALVAAAATSAVSLLGLGLLTATQRDPSTLLLVLVLYFAGSLLYVVLFALPILFVLRSMGLVNWWSMLLVGAIIGIVVGWNSLQQTGPASAGGVWPWLIAGILAGPAGRYAWLWSERRYEA